MCLYPKLILNRKYLPNAKNGGIVPPLPDERVKYVAAGCGKCMECKKQKARNWKVRLQEEIEHDKSGIFVSLTFSNEEYEKLYNKTKGSDSYDHDNEIATYAVRHFLERWRKEHKKSIKHWLITELGGGHTEHIHLHGLLFTDKRDKIKKLWQYGYVYLGEYVNLKTINYMIKYVTKTDSRHTEYNQKILCSKGLGKQYTQGRNSIINKYKSSDTKEYYINKQGYKLSLPTYYRNKLYSDDEREKLWLQLLDKQVRYVNGIKIDISKSTDQYNKILKTAQEVNKELGYGDDVKDWDKIRYERQLRRLKQQLRLKK